MREHASRETWTSIFFTMARSSKTEMDALMNTDVVDFFYIYKAFQEKVKNENEILKKNGRYKS